jgi:hypothetical protein
MAAPMDDITVVALTIGEPYLERALASAVRQTLPPAATVVVRGVTPFHRALNHGAAQVRTPFFVQLDADVVLDDTCLAELRSLMTDNVSITSGLLRDPIVGRTTGVRLYRTACFGDVQIRDSISPDMDFTDDTARLGWIRRCVLRWPSADRDAWHTVGEHRPDYTPLYTYSKFRLEGVRARYRRRERRAELMLQRLWASRHPASAMALIAMAHGFFHCDAADQLRPYEPTADFAALQDILAAPDGPAVAPPEDASDPRLQFRRAYAFGVECRQRRARAALFAAIERHRLAAPVPVAIAALSHGVFQERYDEARADAAYDALCEIL